jgi:putative transposase
MVFHVLNRAAKRTRLFQDPQDYEAFEGILQKAVARANIALFAYCIMPNHWHLLLTPRAEGGLSRCMHWLTTTHARRWQDSHGTPGLGAVYQGRFKALPIRADDHFLCVCRYIERNPLRASLVSRAEDWCWSSAHGDRRAWLADWPIPRPLTWISLLNTPQSEGEVGHLRQAIQLGKPLGDEGWATEARNALGLSPRSHGRPQRMP